MLIFSVESSRTICTLNRIYIYIALLKAMYWALQEVN